MGVHFEALDGGVLLVPLDPRYAQFGLNLVQVWLQKSFHFGGTFLGQYKSHNLKTETMRLSAFLMCITINGSWMFWQTAQIPAHTHGCGHFAIKLS